MSGINSIKLSSYQASNITDNSGNYNYNLSINEDRDNVGSLLNLQENSDIFSAIAEEIATEIGFLASDTIVDDIRMLIEIQAYEANSSTSISAFLGNVIGTIQQLAKDDNNTINDDITEEVLEDRIEKTNSEQFVNSLNEEQELGNFLKDMLYSISSGGILDTKTNGDAILLGNLLGIDQERAFQIVQATGGDISKIIAFITQSDEIGGKSTNEDEGILTHSDILNFNDNITDRKLDTLIFAGEMAPVISEQEFPIDLNDQIITDPNGIKSVATAFLGGDANNTNEMSKDIDYLFGFAASYDGDATSLSEDEARYFMALVMATKEAIKSGKATNASEFIENISDGLTANAVNENQLGFSIEEIDKMLTLSQNIPDNVMNTVRNMREKGNSSTE